MISEEETKKIRHLLETWEEPGNPARLRFEKCLKDRQPEIVDACKVSEEASRITSDDLRFVINV